MMAIWITNDFFSSENVFKSMVTCDACQFHLILPYILVVPRMSDFPSRGCHYSLSEGSRTRPSSGWRCCFLDFLLLGNKSEVRVPSEASITIILLEAFQTQKFITMKPTLLFSLYVTGRCWYLAHDPQICGVSASVQEVYEYERKNRW